MGDRQQQFQQHPPTPKLPAVQRFQKVQLRLCTFKAKLKSIFSASEQYLSPPEIFSVIFLLVIYLPKWYHIWPKAISNNHDEDSGNSACLQRSKLQRPNLWQNLRISQKNHAYNFIIVNDSSTNNTLPIIENSLNTFPTHHIKLISYTNRQGKGYAVKKGRECVDAHCICLMDGDLV